MQSPTDSERRDRLPSKAVNVYTKPLEVTPPTRHTPRVLSCQIHFVAADIELTPKRLPYKIGLSDSPSAIDSHQLRFIL